jgi:uncharacterized protein (AIM24 family)
MSPSVNSVEEQFVRDEEFLRHFKKGREELDKGNFESACTTLEKAYELSPNSEGVENLLGIIYFQREDYKKAENIYRKLVKRNPYVFTLRANLGLIYFKGKKYFDSVRELNEAVRLKPDYTKAHNYLGLVYSELGKYKSAREEFLRAGSRTMAKKIEEVIAGIRKPETLQAHNHGETGKKYTAEPKPIGDLIVDPELKKMLDDFEEDKKTSASDQSESGVEHIRLEKDTEGLVEVASGERAGAESSPPHSKKKDQFKSSFYLGLDEDEPGSSATNILNIDFSGSTYSRVKGMIAAEGNLEFEPVRKSFKGKSSDKNLGGEDDPLMKIIGDGKILLSPEDKKLKILTIKPEEILYLKESSILAFQSGISWENGKISLDETENLELVQFKGEGDVAIIFLKHPVIHTISEHSPFKVSTGAIIGWQGKIIPRIVHISPTKENSSESSIPFIEFTGNGRVIIE